MLGAGWVFMVDGWPTGAGPLRVLIVEDEALVALDLERHLRASGHDVVGIADNRDEALALFEKAQPDFVLMDIRIRGDADGLQVATEIGKLRDVPIVFLTAYADEETIERAAQASAYGYLLKPFDDRTLSATIRIATERHAAEQRQRMLYAAASSAHIGIAVLEVRESALRVTFQNPALTTLGEHLGFPVADTGVPLLEACEDTEASRALRQAVARRESVEVLLSGATKAGGQAWISVSCSPVAARQQGPAYVVLSYADVSRAQEAERLLAAHQRLDLVGQLAAGVAHDFNNLLGVILSCAELALQDVPSQALRRDLLDIADAARRGAVLTRRLLSFARAEHASGESLSDLSDAVSRSSSLLRQVGGSAVRLEFSGASEPLPVALDDVSVEQILLNLLHNARDAMPDGGKVRVRVRKGPSQEDGATVAILEVDDTGSGMSPEVLAQVFTPLFTTKEKGRGTGLGLAMCRLLVERAGGSMSAVSHIGQGTVFRIELPLLAPPRKAAVSLAPEVHPVHPPAGGTTVLLVEDEDRLRRACRRVLEQAGFRVVEQRDGEGAIELLNNGEEVDLVVCDLALPGMRGDQVVAQVRASWPSIPCIVVTGQTEQEGPLIEGPVLRKPFSGADLVRTAHLAMAETS
jgi:two-component system cell cycle sensor histidine kinase/response regulator CckA